MKESGIHYKEVFIIGYKCCNNCLYHTYETSYVGYCRINKHTVASIEATECEDYKSNTMIGGVNEYKRN